MTSTDNFGFVNVLEVVLEKESRGSFAVSDAECAKFLGKLGLDLRPGVVVEGVQICPNGRGVLFITLKEQVEISRYCRYDVMEVSQSGIKAVLIKPAGIREVIVTIKGLHPNTGDEKVINYLEKFGRIVTNRVVYGVFLDGPLKGIKNGDRKYRLEIKPGVNIGSYHLFDSQKVTLRYAGQQQTCGRCLKVARERSGRGIARRCEAEGGVKGDFSSYIRNLWEEIGYAPSNNHLDNIGDDSNEIDEQVGGGFTPYKCVSSPEKFTGLAIKAFPNDMDHGEIVEYLVKIGLPEGCRDLIKISNKGKVTINELDNSLCLELIDKIHGKVHFNRKMFCNGIIQLTPEKEGPSNLLFNGSTRISH